MLVSFEVFWQLCCPEILQCCENVRLVQGRKTLRVLSWRKGTRKPTGTKDLLKETNKSKPSTEQDAINSKTKSCRKSNLVEILINLQNAFCINRETFQSQWAEKLILEWHLFDSTFMRARRYPAQILLYLHLVTRDIQMLI